MSATTPNPSTQKRSEDPFSTPIIIEGLVKRFKYWNETIQEGIQYQGHLYARVRTYLDTERLQAFADSYEYANAGSKVCISVSKRNYTLWVDLRSCAVG